MPPHERLEDVLLTRGAQLAGAEEHTQPRGWHRHEARRAGELRKVGAGVLRRGVDQRGEAVLLAEAPGVEAALGREARDKGGAGGVAERVGLQEAGRRQHLGG